jgi:hypothetical protein
MTKEFHLEGQNQEKQPNYKDQILHIINEHEEAVRAISPEGPLDAETHGQVEAVSKEEWREFEKVRRDVCEAFGVTEDPRHVYIYDEMNAPTNPDGKQRAFRAFCVVVDALKKEVFYADGRIDHITLFDELVTRINGRRDYAAMNIFYGEHKGPSRYLFFKGFIDKSDFTGLSPEAVRILRTPIYDSEGKQIETPANWFITGHNLQNHA